MADYSNSKQQFANEMQSVAAELLRLLGQMDNLNAAFNVHGFATGGQNAFVDSDFASQNTHLSATILNDTMFALGTVATAATTGVRNSLRECIVGGLP